MPTDSMMQNRKPWLALLCAAIVLSAAFTTAVRVHAQIGEDEPEVATTPAPYSEFQYATLTGTNNTVNITMLPVVLSNGSIVYKNVTIPIAVTESSTGAVTLTPGTLNVTAAPTPQINSFKSGNYASPSTVYSGNGLITVNGPSVASGGATEWTLAASSGANGCTYPSSAMWYVGSLASNPALAARLKQAGITNTAYSYGILGEGPTCFPGNDWYAGSIIGVSQVGNSLTVASFTSGGVTDHNTAIDQITFVHK